MTDTGALRDLLAFDPLSTAERVTGKSYKADEGTMALGFSLAIDHNQRKSNALAASGDTHFSQTLAEAEKVYAAAGFAKVASWPFEGSGGIAEELAAWWHPDGLLLTVESYMGTRVNSAKVRYNVSSPEPRPADFFRRTSSGSLTADDVWAGDHDVREGLIVAIEGLREVGAFLPVWVRQPFMWLLTYMDTKVEGYDYAAISTRRIADLPADVRAAIAGEVSA